ncbi:MAG: prepilin peptidase [Aquificae bacterium]|nr:prepilin peptidase [Aquificota bacterium]
MELCYLAAFLVGLVLGSFYNVLIYRLPRGEPVVFTRSRCPHCGRTIPWHDNLPLISFVLLKGKCRFCSGPISLRYPLVELGSGLLAVLSCYLYGLTLEAVYHYLFFSYLLIVALTDWLYFVIPPVLSVGSTILFLLLSFFRPSVTPAQAFTGAALGLGLVLLIYAYYRLVRKVEGIGLGDGLLLASVGAFGGPLLVFYALLIGSVTGLLYALPLLVKHRSTQFVLPFGPFLALGAFLGTLFKDELTALLLGV